MTEEIRNRRRHFRFNAEKGSLGLRKSRSGENLGDILNISYGGIAYRYVPQMVQPDSEFQFDMFFAGNRALLLNGVTTEIIYDFDASEVFQVSSGMYRVCGIKFTLMGEKHKYQIEQCIKKYTFIKQYMN